MTFYVQNNPNTHKVAPSFQITIYGETSETHTIEALAPGQESREFSVYFPIHRLIFASISPEVTKLELYQKNNILREEFMRLRKVIGFDGWKKMNPRRIQACPTQRACETVSK